MGSIRAIDSKRVLCYIPKNFVLTLKDEYKIKNFIETGTFQGDTSLWAADHFEKVITIEASDEYYNTCKNKFKNKNNIDLYKGLSYEVLDNLKDEYLNAPAIFWLDSHWTGEGSFGKDIIHPLLPELKVIRQTGIIHFIFIDDLRFLSYPTRVGSGDEWPLVGDIFRTLNFNIGYEDDIFYNFSLLGDCIFAFPNDKKIMKLLNNFKEDIYINYV